MLLFLLFASIYYSFLSQIFITIQNPLMYFALQLRLWKYLLFFILSSVRNVQNWSFLCSRIWTKYRYLHCKSPYTVEVREKTDQKNIRICSIIYGPNVSILGQDTKIYFSNLRIQCKYGKMEKYRKYQNLDTFLEAE